MKNTLEYKGYIGTIEFSEEDAIFFGKVIGIRALLSYEGYDATSLVADFHNTIDEYLEMCRKEGLAPEVAYKGVFNVRIPPELHKQATVAALSRDISLNRFIEISIRKELLATQQS